MKKVVWALFDSGNGSYAKAAKHFNEIEIYSIGLDIENKNNHFINLNLADYSYLFGDNKLFETLDSLPKPDVIIASPPCESWSIASAMKDGNASWKQEKGDGLFSSQTPLSKFTIRNYRDYDNYQFYPEKSMVNRINGELCTLNLIKIIQKYSPAIYIIENPATSRMWAYIDEVLGFHINYDNLTYYNNYNYPLKKPTRFKSNVELQLKTENLPGEIEFGNFSKSYNERSNIPGELVKEIFKKTLVNLEKESAE